MGGIQTQNHLMGQNLNLLVICAYYEVLLSFSCFVNMGPGISEDCYSVGERLRTIFGDCLVETVAGFQFQNMTIQQRKDDGSVFLNLSCFILNLS